MRIGMAAVVVVLGALSAHPAAAAQRCPAGSYLIMDNMGKYQCEPVGAKPAAVARAMNGGCPSGTRPWKDFGGNSLCRSAESLSGIGKPSGIQGWPPQGPNRTLGPPGQPFGLD
ncbi:MAG: hypothetical protein JWL84_4057 [Rhodospirillales bacterium]|jgi:hypothetical protein|nr:hypothetical protein [Rhodospirillales bacterium]